MGDWDVIVIGAGSVGTPAAWALARAGRRVLVLDRLPSVGQGSNKHAIGGIRATHSDPAKVRLGLRSIDMLSTWRDEYGDEIEWYRGGYAFVVYRPQEEQSLRDLLTVQQAWGLNIGWLDAQETLRLVPDLNPHELRGCVYSPEDGNASPLLAVHAFYRHARQMGAQFRFGEAVTDILIHNDKVQGVVTAQGTYHADVVLLAAGAWARPLAQRVGLDVPVQSDAHEAGVTEPVQRFFDPLIVDIRPYPDSSNIYFYQHYTGQIMFCITPSPNAWGEDTRETSRFLPMSARRLLQIMPRLQHIRVRRTWRGLYPMTPDGSPIVGWAGPEGLLLAVGMCGQGFMLGPGLSELLTRMVGGALTPTDQDTLARLSLGRAFVGQERLK